MSSGEGSPNAGAIDEARFREAAQVYPQPVAAACGRCIRFTNPGAQLDACLKAAEVLCRYLAVLALASLRSRNTEKFPSGIEEPVGPLSFGHYLSLVQAAAKVDGHPLSSYLGPFRARGRGRGPGKADAALTSLLELRNEVGHGLSVPEGQASFLMRRDHPHGRLLTALGSQEGLLSLPLFVLKTVEVRDRRMYAQRLLLMGESRDPFPDEIQLIEPLQDLMPYVALGDVALPLQPGMFFAQITSRPVQRLALLDKVEEDRLVLQTLDSEVVREYDARNAWDEIFSTQTSAPHAVRLPEGSESLPKEWSKRRKHIEATVRQTEGVPPWTDYDRETLDWYARGLADRAVETDSESRAGSTTPSSVDIILAELLDGRSSGLTDAELRQLLLLFGQDAAVRAALGRDMFDFRRRSSASVRWDRRETGSRNVFGALHAAMSFFTGHMGLKSHEADDLTRTSGSADYIAMREALVNQFIHQDYSDPSAAAQLTLLPRRAVFFNPGYSLVSTDALVDGDRSQARNPLIALALRLIGYAELGGSGIRVLQHEWRRIRRRPPLLETDRKANTFTLTLDWREVPSAYDSFWKDSIGALVTAEQALILDFAADSTGITAQQAAGGTGLPLDDAREALAYLVREVLLDEKEGRYHLAAHLREALPWL